MRDFINPLSQISPEDNDKMFSEQGINIVDFETVSYDKNCVGPKRSLSLNIYKYEQILGPKQSEECLSETPGAAENSMNDTAVHVPASESPDAAQRIKKDTAVYNVKFSKKMTLLIAFVLMVSICCLAVIATVTFKVFENNTLGNGILSYITRLLLFFTT